MAFGLIVGSVGKIWTLPSSEIHDGLGSWHGDERSRPQWLIIVCQLLGGGQCVPGVGIVINLTMLLFGGSKSLELCVRKALEYFKGYLMGFHGTWKTVVWKVI